MCDSIIEEITHYDFTSSSVKYFELLDFLRENKDNFFDNEVIQDFIYDKSKKPIPKGMKITKALKYFIFDQNDLQTLQDLISEYIQKTKITGYLCMSVHPLDFLSLSVNNHKWRSCHALDGEYRSGNLSYMCDSTTIICYIRSVDDVILNGFKTDKVLWNDKKWRMLLFVQPNMIFAGRQYPFTIPKILDTIKQIFVPILTKTSSSNWTNWTDETVRKITMNNNFTYYYSSPMICLQDKIIQLKELVEDNDSEEEVLHYNDLLYSTCYKPKYIQQYNWFGVTSTTENTHFTIGSKVKCLCCNKNYLKDSDSMVCYSCAKRIYRAKVDTKICAICGKPHPVEDMYLIQGLTGNVYVCVNCFANRELVVRCPSCGILTLKSALNSDNICPWCQLDSQTSNYQVTLVNPIEAINQERNN